mgnify:CR=1 FL=1
MGSVGAEKALEAILNQFGVVHESANVSRIDLFVDFVSSESMESWDRHAWLPVLQRLIPILSNVPSLAGSLGQGVSLVVAYMTKR